MRGRAAACLRAGVDKLAAWGAEESGRLFNWVPVGLGLGIALYFSLEFEPELWVGGVALCACAGLAILARRRAALRLVFLAFLTVALGFASAEWRARAVATPEIPWQNLARLVDGTVEQVRQSPDKPLKLIISNPVIAGLEAAKTPRRLALTIRTKSDDLAPGDNVELRAVMMPPGAPVIPGGFDYARQSYFQGIGGVGFAISPVLRLPAVRPAASLLDRFNLGLEKLRRRITEKIISDIPGPAGGLAAALTTGIRDGIPQDVVLAMRNSGLAHLLAIAGLHMGIVTGIVFFALRALMATIPALALNFPIKKWAAVAAGLVAVGYLLISGASLPTMRAFAMGSLVFIALLLDRNPFSMRLLAFAAILILVVKPESLLSVSFQMSFAAVAALIAIYEGLHGAISQWRSAHPGPIAGIFFYLLAITVTSLAATLATAPFVIYHFNQIALYGLVGNILAIPLVAFWIFPWAIVAFALMPFHLEALAMGPLGAGVRLLIRIAETVSALPHASLSLPGYSLAALSVIVLGGAWLCLWRTPLRLLGGAIMAAGVAMAMSGGRPDILVDGQGKLIAVKGAGGAYLVSSLRAGKYARDSWLRYNGQAVADKWPLVSGRDNPSMVLTCNSEGCLYAPWQQGRGGAEADKGPRILLHGGKAEMGGDCDRADLVVSSGPVACKGPALIVDRFNSYYYGAQAIWISRTHDGGWAFRVASVAGEEGRRPWSTNPQAPPWLAARSRVTAYVWKLDHQGLGPGQ